MTFASWKMEGRARDIMSFRHFSSSGRLFLLYSFLLLHFIIILLPHCPTSTLSPSLPLLPLLTPIDRSHNKPFVSTSGSWHDSRKLHEKLAVSLAVAISSSQQKKRLRARKKWGGGKRENGKWRRRGGGKKKKIGEELSPGIKISELSFFFSLFPSLPLPHSNCS